MGASSAALELRIIVEKLRNRFSVPARLEGTAWNPKVMEVPPGDRFLVVCPHPDDDAVGCGGTIVKLLDAGKDVRVMYLSIQKGDFSKEERLAEISASLSRMKVSDHVLLDNDFPSSAEATEAISREIDAFSPDTVFVPSPFENHNQHLRTFQSFCSSCTSSDKKMQVAMYEVWGTLMPNLLVDITSVMPAKIEAVSEHRTQMRDIDYVRVIKGINGYRAAASALDGYAEAFMYMGSRDLLRSFPR